MKRRDFLRGGVVIASFGIAEASNAQALTINPNLQNLLIRFCKPGTRTRRNVYTLLNQDPNHPTIAAYRQGVQVMKSRPISNPTSWLYQAAIHGTNLAQNQWPANAPFDTCEHNTIFFLSWHRMYLHFFERIVRAASGTSSFALPYWNYSLAGQAALPPPFRTSAGNALFDGTRGAGMNTGSNLPASAVNITTALGKTQFLGGSQFQGSLEGTPHGVVHSTIGGNMGAFATAGLDPIFWLHHCNIDRLWEKWLSQGGGRVNPTGNTSWMDDEFTFSDETGALVEMSGSDVLFTASQLKYRYDDPSTCIPLLIFQTVAESKLILASRRVRNIASFVVAKDLRLSPSEERISIKADTSGPNRERLARLFSQDAATISPQSGARWSIVFEGVRTAAPADGYYEVYVNLPPNTRPDFNSPHYVGNLSLFGADEQSRRSMKSAHAGHADQGMTVALEASDELKRLVDRGDVQNGELTITLVPQGVSRQPGEPVRLDEKAAPQIGAVLLSLDREVEE